MDGQISLFSYMSGLTQTSGTCSNCICSKCLFYASGRCFYGYCFDDLRAVNNPYPLLHPNEPPRRAWSNWSKIGEQEHWCRGGIFYPSYYCDNFVKFEGMEIQECVRCNILIYQDGFVSCPLKSTIGCDACIDIDAKEEKHNSYNCEFMSETGCEPHIQALLLMAGDILNGGLEQEMCKEQCCMHCNKICGFRCGRTY